MGSKTPTMKRILKEATELSQSASPDYHATPLENNIFEWHFTLRGPPSPSPFSSGIYHGRISLPPTYPLRPPSFRFLTPSGRFEVNREICLSISGHHEETWQPAWGIRTALVAIRSFMDTDAKGQIGGLQGTEGGRRDLAVRSRGWGCPTCGLSNQQILDEKARNVAEMGGDSEKTDATGEGEEEAVPEELRLDYRDELEKAKAEQEGAQSSSEKLDSKVTREESGTAISQSRPEDTTRIQPQPPRQVATDTTQQRTIANQAPRSMSDVFIDTAIVLFATIFGILALKKVLYWLSS